MSTILTKERANQEECANRGLYVIGAVKAKFVADCERLLSHDRTMTHLEREAFATNLGAMDLLDRVARLVEGPSSLLEDKIREWREDDEQGYDTAIDLLCEAEDELRRLRALVTER